MAVANYNVMWFDSAVGHPSAGSPGWFEPYMNYFHFIHRHPLQEHENLAGSGENAHENPEFS